MAWNDNKSECNFRDASNQKPMKKFGLSSRGIDGAFFNEDSNKNYMFQELEVSIKNPLNAARSFRRTGNTAGLERSRVAGSGDSLQRVQSSGNPSKGQIIKAGASLTGCKAKTIPPEQSLQQSADFDDYPEDVSVKRGTSAISSFYGSSFSRGARPKSAVVTEAQGNDDGLKSKCETPRHLFESITKLKIGSHRASLQDTSLHHPDKSQSRSSSHAPVSSDRNQSSLSHPVNSTTAQNRDGYHHNGKSSETTTKEQLRQAEKVVPKVYSGRREIRSRKNEAVGSSKAVPIVLDNEDSDEGEDDSGNENNMNNESDKNLVAALLNSPSRKPAFGHIDKVPISAVFFGSKGFFPTSPTAPIAGPTPVPLVYFCIAKNLNSFQLVYRDSGDWTLPSSYLLPDSHSEAIPFDGIANITHGKATRSNNESSSNSKLGQEKAKLYSDFSCFIALNFYEGTTFKSVTSGVEIQPGLDKNVPGNCRKYLLLLLSPLALEDFLIKIKGVSSLERKLSPNGWLLDQTSTSASFEDYNRDECLDELFMAVTENSGEVCRAVTSLRGPSKRRSARKREYLDNELVPEPGDERVLFLYPMEQEAQDVITITQGDRRRLDPGKYLNDNLIDFQLKRILEESLSPPGNSDLRVHLFSCLFFAKLTEGSQNSSRKTGDHKLVERWTKAVNIFDKDYLIVPINDCTHWSLAVIVNPSEVQPLTINQTAPSARKRRRVSSPEDNPSQSTVSSLEEAQLATVLQPPIEVAPSTRKGFLSPCILFMDSLGMHKASMIADVLRMYLQGEWAAKYGAVKVFDKSNLPLQTCRNYIPHQSNSYDCGAYVIRYAEMVTKKLTRHAVEAVKASHPETLDTNCYGSTIRNSLPDDVNVIKEIFSESTFDQQDIDKLRDQMQTTLKRLASDWVEELKRRKQDKVRLRQQEQQQRQQQQEQQQQLENTEQPSFTFADTDVGAGSSALATLESLDDIMGTDKEGHDGSPRGDTSKDAEAKGEPDDSEDQTEVAKLTEAMGADANSVSSLDDGYMVEKAKNKAIMLHPSTRGASSLSHVFDSKKPVTTVRESRST